MSDKGISVFTHNGEDYNINDPNIAGEFYPNSNYAVGDHVTYEGKLYVFTAAHTGAWTGTDVTQVQIGAELHDYGAHAMVRYDVAQTLTDPQKVVAQNNIGAAAASAIGIVPTGETVEGQITDLKSAFVLSSDENIIADNISMSQTTLHGITMQQIGGYFRFDGTLASGETFVHFKLYDSTFPAWIKTDTAYELCFEKVNPALHLQIYAYNASNNVLTLCNTENDTAPVSIVFPEDYNTKVMIRFKIKGAGATIAETVRFSLSEIPSNSALNQISNRNFADDNYILNNVVNLSLLNGGKSNGITYTVNPFSGIVTLNGTASSNFLLTVCKISAGCKKLILHGAPDDGESTTYNLAVYQNGARVGYVIDSVTYKTITLSTEYTTLVRIVVFSGQTVNNLVFAPVVYTSGIIMDILDEINAPRPITPEWKYYNGTCFITHCGNKLFIDNKAFRLYNDVTGSYTSTLSSTSLTLTATTVRYIDFDGTNFSIQSNKSTKSIAFVYGRSVTPLIDGIISDYRPIQNGYIRNHFYINFARTPLKAINSYSENRGKKVSESGYILDYPGTYYYDLDSIGEKQSIAYTLTKNETDIANKKILIIGDSFVARGYIQHYLSTFVPSLTFIGTKQTQHYGFVSEGVSGSRLYYFTDPDTSPFYFDGNLDFSAYLTNNSLDAPDYVVINSAINHGSYDSDDHGSYFANMNALIAMIKTYNENIKIYVTYGANYAVSAPSVYGYPSGRYTAVRQCCNSTYALDGVTVIPIDMCLIDELDYNWETYSYFGEDLKLLSDCVHPKETTGFQKIAEMIYNYLGV